MGWEETGRSRLSDRREKRGFYQIAQDNILVLYYLTQIVQMEPAFKAQFLRLFNDLSNPNKSISTQANSDLLSLQNNPNVDMWVLSKNLLESSDLTQTILGSLLINNKIRKQESSLDPQFKLSLKQFICQCYLRVNNKGVREKLAEALTLLSREEIIGDWKGYIAWLVGVMKNGDLNICFGLLVLGNVPPLLKDKCKVSEIEKELMEVISSTIALSDRQIFVETLNTLVVWSKYGVNVLGCESVMTELLNRGFAEELQNSLSIFQHSINHLFQLNKGYPLLSTGVPAQTKTQIQQIVMKILSNSHLVSAPENGYMFSELSLSILSKLNWIYQSCYEQIFKLPFRVLELEEHKLSQLGLTYFHDLQNLKLPTDILCCIWKKCLESSVMKCKCVNPGDPDFVDYRYHYREFIGTIFSKFYQLNRFQECNNILVIIHNSLLSSDYQIKELGIFMSLAVTEPLKYMKDLESKTEFIKQLFCFCFNYSTAEVLSESKHLLELGISIEISCLKLLSLNTYEIVSMGIQNEAVQSCINRFKKSHYRCKEHASNLISLIVSSIETINSNHNSMLHSMFDLLKNRHLIGNQLVEMFIGSFIQLTQKFPDCYPFLIQILNQQTQIFKDTHSLQYMQYILKSIERTSSTQLEATFHHIKTLLNSYIAGLAQQTFDQSPLIACITYLHSASYPPFQQIDNQIAQNTIQLIITNPKEHWRLLRILFEALKLLNFRQNQMQQQPFSTWLSNHYSTISSLLVSFGPIVNEEAYYQLFFQIQDEIISYSYQLFTSTKQYLEVFKYASTLIRSSTNPFLIKSILHLYESFLLLNPNRGFDLDLLKSALSGIFNSNSSLYMNYFKILERILKNTEPTQVGRILKQEFLDVLLGAELGVNEINLLVAMTLKSVTMKKSTYFKSLLIEIFNFAKKVVSQEEFGKSMELFKVRFKI